MAYGANYPMRLLINLHSGTEKMATQEEIGSSEGYWIKTKRLFQLN